MPEKTTGLTLGLLDAEEVNLVSFIAGIFLIVAVFPREYKQVY
jgi:hypothetical protein